MRLFPLSPYSLFDWCLQYYFKLTTCLCHSLVVPFIPEQHSAQDTFSFVSNITTISTYGKFMVSFHAESLLTDIALKESISLAVHYIVARG